MGRVTAPWGVKGAVKVQPFGSDSGNLCKFSAWWIGKPGKLSEVAVAECRAHGAYLVARFAGCDDPDKAGAYRGAEVAVRREDLPKPAEHEFYQADLIGLEVVNREGVRLGRVAGFFDGGAHEVMRVDHEGGQRLLPVAGEVIRRVDLDWGVTRRALEQALWSLALWNPRDFTTDNYRTVDDRPYGGGPGMVMLAEPLEKAIAAAKAAAQGDAKVIHLSPQGSVVDHKKVMALAEESRLVLLCGRYEGVDERLIARAVDEELSIGDYVLSGGELAAMVLIDAIVRQLPGALGDGLSAEQDSFVNGLLDCPQYTRPEVYEGEAVPPVLMSGHHARIERWRLKQSLGRTWLRRPELLERRGMSEVERKLLDEFKKELDKE